MTDLYLATAISVLLSSLLCAGALVLARHLSRFTATLLVLLGTAGLFFYSVYFHDDLRIARFLPFASVMILGNPTPQLTALIVGFGWRLVPGGRLRKGLILMPLVGVSLYLAYVPAFPTTPSRRNAVDQAGGNGVEQGVSGPGCGRPRPVRR